MKLVMVEAPEYEPVGLDEARQYLRVDHYDDDGLLVAQIQAVREQAETFTRRAFVTRTYDLFFDRWPRFPLALPHPPLQSVTGIYYTPDGGSEATWASSNYVVDTHGPVGRVVLSRTAQLPVDELAVTNGVRVRFVAGYGGPETVPESLRAAMLLWLGDRYENRENTVIGAGNSLVQVPFGAKHLLWPYRVEW